MLPHLFDLIHRETPVEVRNEIFKLLGEIKSPEAVPVIVDSLEKKDFGEFLPSFIAACWQSGLDFSNHLRIFAELFIHGDYITSLESFTLLEEAFPNATDDARISCIRYIRDSEHLVLDEKLPLFRELRRVIESI
jgi:HEAT repeat protein